MRETASNIARAAIRGISAFFTMVANAIADWVRGDDLTFIIVLVVVALLLLVFFVPAGRRY